MTRRAARAMADAAAGAPLRAQAARVRHDIKASVGQPLDGALRERMEVRFAGTERVLPPGAARGFQSLETAADRAARDRSETAGRAADFSSVRLHSDGHAASAARRLGARAFTVGDHVYADPTLASAGPSAQPSLLAHELAHVVQQRQLNRQMIQPRLIADGNDAEIRRFMALAEAAMGEELSRDPATHEVTAVASLANPATSPVFAAAMHRVMDDSAQNAQVNFGVGQTGVVVGAFPNPNDMTGGQVQRIDIDDLEAIEAAEPGNGLALLAHEITENYEAHATAPVAGVNLLTPSHRLAIGTESDVAEDIVGPGRRVAEAQTLIGPVFTVAFDFDNYYSLIVFTADATGNFAVTSARRAPRANVLTSTIDHYVTGASAIPVAGAAPIAATVAALVANPLATVRVEGFTDTVGTVGANLVLSFDRADVATAAVTAGGVQPMRINSTGAGQDRPVAPNDTEAHRAQNRRVVLTVDQPGP